MGELGFYRDPAIDGDTIAFVCDDAIWTARIDEGVARRRTPRIESIATPVLDRRRERLVFAASPSGPMQVCVVSLRGGRVRQLTHFQDVCRVLGRARDGRFVFCSPAGRPFRELVCGWLIDVETRRLERMAANPLVSYSAARDAVVTSPPAVPPRTWRGYRGGAKGEIHVDAHGGGFLPIAPVAANVSSPVVCSGRIYFVAEEGDALNLCSCNLDGGDLRQWIMQQPFAVHSLATDGSRIVCCAGADLFLFDGQDPPRKLEIELAEHVQGRRTATRKVALSLAAGAAGSSRGRTVTWCAFGAVFEWDFERSVARRIDLGRYCSRIVCAAGRALVAVVAGAADDELVLVGTDAADRRSVEPSRSIGRVFYASIASTGDRIVIANHRYELLGIDLATGKTTQLARSFHRVIDQYDISPDGTLCVCALPVGLHRTAVHLVSCDDGRAIAATEPRLADFSPRFLPNGSVAFLSLQAGVCAAQMVTTVNVLVPPYAPVEACGHRVLVPREAFARLVTLGDAIAVLRAPAGTPRAELLSAPHASPRVWSIGADHIEPLGGARFLVRAGLSLQVGRWVNGRLVIGHAEDVLGALEARFDVVALRKAAVLEAWRIACEEVPVRAVGPTWTALRERYASLVDRACTSQDALDIQNEMLGNLRLSHASVTRSFPPAPSTQRGLGIDIEFDYVRGAWRVVRIPKVDPHSSLALGLADPALGVRVGDCLAALDGVRATSSRPPAALLHNKASRQVRCTVIGADLESHEVVFETLEDDRPLRYAAWVHARAQMVARATGGQVGYLHIPDVNARSRADVERWVWCHEAVSGIVVDLRFNKGGMYGGEIAEFLARPAIAHVRTRWSSARAIPTGSGLRPIVVLTNRFTVSGGELLAETLRLLALAAIIGETTFGGALGQTNPRPLPDGFALLLPEMEVTAPVQWAQIENRGVVPDVEVPCDADAEAEDRCLMLALQTLDDRSEFSR